MTRDFYLKQAILNDDLDKNYNHARKVAFKGDRSALDAFEAIYGKEVARVARNLCNSSYGRYKRVHDKTSSIVLGGECLFLTLTFRDDVFASTSALTRRKYVRRYLKEQCDTYVANIDFGKDKGREHYHALVYSSHIDYKPWFDKCGAIDWEHVRSNDGDSKAVSKYITKLSRHALKESTQSGLNSPRLIYSRKVVSLPPAFLFDDD
jgi:hypothetical protein